MKRYACWLVGLLLFVTAFNLSSLAQVRGRKHTRVTTSAAKPGFYIQFEMCHACAYWGWQKDIISAFGRSGSQAFVSDDISSHYSEQSYWTLRSLRVRRGRDEHWSLPVYGGPFETEYSAKRVFSHLPSILNQALDKYDKQRAEIGDTTRWSHQFERCTGNQCQLAGFFIQLVRVQR